MSEGWLRLLGSIAVAYLVWTAVDCWEHRRERRQDRPGAPDPSRDDEPPSITW